MDGQDFLAEGFESNRSHLRSVAYRMLGSMNEADDAVQEAWLRLSRTGSTDIDNLKAWLTTVVSRVCLDMLRSRKSRREQSLDASVPDSVVPNEDAPTPEDEAALADSVGVAVLVVLETLTPAERLAFVLHDMFDVSFEEIATIVGRSPMAARQLASRARRRLRGTDKISSADLPKRRKVVDAFLAALRAGDFQGLLAVLDPDVVVRSDVPGRPGAPTEIRGAVNWAKGAIAFSRLARFVQPALVNGSPGLVIARRGQLLRALSFKIVDDKIIEFEVIADLKRVRELEVALLPDSHE
jgi:RNA polymerase sigma-70 factor (ECF subfamily)